MLQRPRAAGACGPEKADVYSAALVIWSIRAAAPPHDAVADAVAARHAADAAVQLRPAVGVLKWPELAAALAAAWAHEPGRRPAASEVMEAVERLGEALDRSHGCGSAACRQS